MSKTNVDWRKHLTKINYLHHTNMTDKQITSMLFLPGNDRNTFLKWIAGEFLGVSEGNFSEKALLNTLCRHVYIPKAFQDAFVKGNMLSQRDLHTDIWEAIFEALHNKKNIPHFEEDNGIDLLEECRQVFAQPSTRKSTSELANAEPVEEETARLLKEWELVVNEVKDSTNVPSNEEVFKFKDYIEKYFEFFEKYNEEIKPLVMENIEMQCDPALKQLQIVLPSLLSSFSRLEKFCEDRKKLLEILEKLEELRIKESDTEINSNNERCKEVYLELQHWFSNKLDGVIGV